MKLAKLLASMSVICLLTSQILLADKFDELEKKQAGNPFSGKKAICTGEGLTESWQFYGNNFTKQTASPKKTESGTYKVENGELVINTPKMGVEGFPYKLTSGGFKLIVGDDLFTCTWN